ncbi:MAG: hypothetical protein QE271_05890 [Bacteriovoracaceae bacterium]|nr:hypothetical protein [Bacteriovoracaceae bacterium]
MKYGFLMFLMLVFYSCASNQNVGRVPSNEGILVYLRKIEAALSSSKRFNPSLNFGKKNMTVANFIADHLSTDKIIYEETFLMLKKESLGYIFDLNFDVLKKANEFADKAYNLINSNNHAAKFEGIFFFTGIGKSMAKDILGEESFAALKNCPKESQPGDCAKATNEAIAKMNKSGEKAVAGDIITLDNGDKVTITVPEAPACPLGQGEPLNNAKNILKSFKDSLRQFKLNPPSPDGFVEKVNCRFGLSFLKAVYNSTNTKFLSISDIAKVQWEQLTGKNTCDLGIRLNNEPLNMTNKIKFKNENGNVSGLDCPL